MALRVAGAPVEALREAAALAKVLRVQPTSDTEIPGTVTLTLCVITPLWIPNLEEAFV
jgi:hypothetical protein